MKRTIKILMLSFLIFSLPSTVYARTNYADEIYSMAEDYSITKEDVSNFTLTTVIDYIKENRRDKFQRPIKICINLCGIIIISAVCSAVKINGLNENIISCICTLFVFLRLIEPINTIVTSSCESLIEVKNYMTAFLPIYAGVTAASGYAGTSAVATGFFLQGLVFFANVCVDYIIPSLKLFFVMIVANGLSYYIKFNTVCEFYLKAIKTALKLIVSIICVGLSLQTAVSSGADALAIKAGKAIAGTAIPVIGSALQDAVSSVYGAMNSIKSFAGAVGIISVIYIFLPSIISLSAYWLCTYFAYAISGMFGGGPSVCIKGFVDVIELMLSVIILFLIMFIFSVSIMITLTNGV